MSNVKKIRSFVRRNRTLTEANRRLLDVSYPKWGLEAKLDDNIIKWDFEQIFNNQNKTILEIGFGCGDTLILDAKNNPENNYIGIEVFRSGILNILSSITEDNIKNLRVCEGDAKEILINNINIKSIYGVHIYFPDPWPKKRHHKRRLITQEFLDLLTKKIIKNGYIHFATDWEDYACQMKELLEKNSNYSELSIEKNRGLTKFESKGLNKGHTIFDFIYSLND